MKDVFLDIQHAVDRFRCRLAERFPPVARGVDCEAWEGERAIDPQSDLESRLSGGVDTTLPSHALPSLATRSWSIQVDAERVRTQQAQQDAAKAFASADRWEICEIAWFKAVSLRLQKFLDQPRVKTAVAGLTDAQQTKTLIERVGQLSGAGAALGTAIPGIGNVVGAIGGAVAGVALGLVEWLIAAGDLAEQRRRLLVIFGEVIKEVGPPPVPVALTAAKVQGASIWERMSQVIIRRKILERDKAKYAKVPAFPWVIPTEKGPVVASAEDVASMLFTTRERGVGIWPYLEAPSLTFVSQQAGDTPECSSAWARQVDRATRAAVSTLFLDRVFWQIRPYIGASGRLEMTAKAALGNVLVWQNQYSQRAVGTQAGVIDAELACTSLARLDLAALQNYGKVQ